MTTFKRNFLLFSLFFLLIFFWKFWGNFSFSIFKNTLNECENKNLIIKKINNFKSKQYVNIRTDVLSLDINLQGSEIDSVNLLKYFHNNKDNFTLSLLNKSNNDFHRFIINFIEKKKDKKFFLKNKKNMFHANSSIFRLRPNKNELRVPFTFSTKNGLTFIKTFIFKRGSYDIGIEYKVENKSNIPVTLAVYGEMHKKIQNKFGINSFFENFRFQAYEGPVYSSDKKKCVKYNYKNFKKGKDLSIYTKYGWIGFLQKYFFTSWIPSSNSNFFIYTNKKNNKLAIIGMRSDFKTIHPHTSYIFHSKIWAGPIVKDFLANTAKNLDCIIDNGWFWFLSQPLLKLLTFFHNFFKNWGFSIILVTIFLRFLLYPITKMQYLSVIRMKNIYPKIKSIRREFKDDMQKMSTEIFKLYTQEKINPLSSFFPVLIQMPIFLAFYSILVSSIELRNAPFIFWIKDLSEKDPYFILPIFLGISILLLQFDSICEDLNSIQKTIMHFLPLLLIFFFLWFPSGLVLYYTVSNFVTFIQQRIILKNFQLEKKKFLEV